MNSIVTGAAGFIGSTLSRKLTQTGDTVLGIDDLSSGAFRNLKGLSNFHLYLSDSGDLRTVSFKSDILFHLGIPSSSGMYNKQVQKKALKSFDSVLHYCKRMEIPMILTSTSSMYALTCKWDLDNYKPVRAREGMEIETHDFYTSTRRRMELKLLKSEVNCVILRLFSVYGATEESKGIYANVIYQMVDAILNRKKFMIYGKGNQTRDFIFVDDVVEAFVKARDFVFENKGQTIFNVGTGRQTAFKKVVGLLENLTKKRFLAEFKDPPPFYIYRTLDDFSKSTKVLQFKPKVDVVQGLQKILEAP
jgi:nucleoside-diphosphate-sugar epimerase